MNTAKHIITLLLIILATGVGFGQSPKQSAFWSNDIIVKLKTDKRDAIDLLQSGARKAPANLPYKINPMFPGRKPLNGKALAHGEIDLTLYYQFNTEGVEATGQLIKWLESLELFEYVERRVVSEVTFTPNDPLISSQGYLAQVKAYQGWDQTTGSAAVSIGIVDTGTDMDHPDLMSELKTNPADPINGIDDDGDGYIDNFQGWDFVDNDHIPQATVNPHGVQVSGIAAAATNNGTGVSSVGFQTTYIPVRVGSGSLIQYGFEGIIYAADMGADVINCSWGSFSFSQFGQDAVNYATLTKNALVVAAAGNQGQDKKYYPAALENVLAVTAVDGTDERASYSNYGFWADIAAPGNTIFTTIDNGGYNSNTGTSMATPIVSAAAALVKARYPLLNAVQLGERLKTTTDDIYGVGGNNSYLYKLGTGRLNVANALTGSINSPSVVFSDQVVSNGVDNIIVSGDSLFISGKFTNYLAASGALTATLSTSSVFIQTNVTVFNIGVLNSLAQTDNYTGPFSMLVSPATPINEKITFRLDITDGTYTEVIWFEMKVNVDYLDIEENDLSLTVTSRSLLGYNRQNQEEGNGFRLLNGPSLLYEGGLMIGTKDVGFKVVSDNVRKDANSSDNDFERVAAVHVVSPPASGDFQLSTVFNDSNSAGTVLGVEVHQKTYAFSDPGHRQYIVLEYALVNQNIDSITGLYAGIFTDFDMEQFDKNRAGVNQQRYLGYTKSTVSGNPVAAVQLLTGDKFRAYCFDNVSGGNGGIDIYNGYSNTQKYNSLTTARWDAGYAQNDGNDVIQLVSTGPFAIAAGDTHTVAFAILASADTTALFAAADSAYFRYNGLLPTGIDRINSTFEQPDVVLYPNPAGRENRLRIELRTLNEFTVQVFDITGKLMVQKRAFYFTEIGLNKFKAGTYMVKISSAGASVWKKFLLIN